MYYITQVDSFQLVKQPNYGYKEVFIDSNIEKRAKSKAQFVETLKESLINEMYMAENGGKFNKLILFNDDTGCVIESRYIIAYLAAMRIDRMYIRCTDINNPITRNDKNIKPISGGDYKYFIKQLKNFFKSIKYKEDDRIVLCS